MYEQAYLEKTEYLDSYDDSVRYMRKFFEPFDEFERLANNKVREDLPDGFPKVNDGTLSAMLQEIPTEILGQMMTGEITVKSVFDPRLEEMVPAPAWLSVLANIIWAKKIIPNANTDATFYVKWVVALYRALKYGGQPIYDFYTINGDYKGADMSLPYVKDVYLEANKVSDLASDYIFMDSYYTKLKIRRIIAQAKELAQQGVQSPWDVEALQMVLDSAMQDEKDERAKNAQERDKGIDQTGIKFTTVFQRGKGAPFCTFHRGLGSDGAKSDGGILVVRETTNKNPMGDVPIHYLYTFQDLENPLGRGKIETSGGTQNVLDYFTQADVLATQIGLQPPINIAGSRTNTDLNSLLWSPNRFWFTGDAKVDIMRNDTPIYTQFPQRFGLYKSQLLNVLARTDASISADAGNPGFSKTDAGVKFQATRSGNADNFIRQMVNQTFNAVARHMINEHFANMQGREVMQVAKEEAEKLMAAGLIDEDPNTPGVPSTDEIELIWDNMRGIFDFEVDPESSMVKNDADQIEKATKAIELFVQNPNLRQEMQQSGVDFKIGEVYKQIFTRLGFQDTEKIVVPYTPQAGDVGAVGPDGQPLQGQPGAGEQPASGDIPPEVQQEIASTMQQYNVDERAALAIIHARRLQIPEEYIAQYLQTGKVQ